MFKDKVKWQDFSETLITAMQQTKGQSDFLLSYILCKNEGGTTLWPKDFDSIDAYE